MYSTQTITALIIGIVLSFVIPVCAVIIYKLKNRETWLPSAFIGAASFFVFAMILEQLLHTVMLPVVQNKPVFYIIYGALAAGVFEETGRFVAYKTLMRKKYSIKNAVMMGLGHGGIEAILVLGVTMLNYLIYIFMINSQGIDSVMSLIEASNPAAAEAVRTQLEGYTTYGFGNMALGIYERILAMTGHVCFSVIVYFAAARPKMVYFYPAAILLHALLDTSAAMYQVGIITNVTLVYGIFTAMTACFVVLTVILAKKLPDRAE